MRNFGLLDVVAVETLWRFGLLVCLCLGFGDFMHGMVQFLCAVASHMGSPILDISGRLGGSVLFEKSPYFLKRVRTFARSRN